MNYKVYSLLCDVNGEDFTTREPNDWHMFKICITQHNSFNHQRRDLVFITPNRSPWSRRSNLDTKQTFFNVAFCSGWPSGVRYWSQRKGWLTRVSIMWPGRIPCRMRYGIPVLRNPKERHRSWLSQADTNHSHSQSPPYTFYMAEH